MKKRIFSILLAVVMLLGMIPGTALTAFAAGNYWTVTYDANGGGGTMTPTEVWKGDDLRLPFCTFSAPEDKQFKAWNVGGTEYDEWEIVPVSSHTTVTAVWEDLPDFTTVEDIVFDVHYEGYSAYTAGQGKNVCVTNTGTEELSGLTVTMVDGSSYFTLVRFTGNTIAPGATNRDYLVQPKTGLTAGTYTATLSIKTPQTKTIYANVTFTVVKNAPSASMENIVFDSVNEGYAQPAAKTIVVTNDGNLVLNSPKVTLISGSENFELGVTSVPGAIPIGAQITNWNIKPKAGLTRGTYTATVQVTATELTTPVTATVTFTVGALTYQVSFDANGGTGSMTPVTHDTKDGQYTIPACTFDAPTGKVFDYWYMDNANNHLQAGDKVTLSANATLKANWKDDPSIAHEIKVNNGNASVATATQGTTITITAPDVSGKIFTGWTVVKGGITVTNTKSATFEMPYADVEITANYIDVNVAMPNITFDSVKEQYTQPSAKPIAFTNNCGVRLTAPVITIIAGETNFELVTTSVPGAIEAGATDNTSYAIKPKAGLTRGTYTATIQLAANELVTPITATVTFVVDALTYTVTFDANGGDNNMTTVTHDTKDGEYTIPDCTMKPPAGKVFDYWYMDNANNHLQAGDKVTLTSNATLKAMWKDDPSVEHTIVINGGTASVGGTTVDKATMGTEITITAPAVSGKIFTGWSASGVALTQSLSATTTFIMPYNVVTITANYVDVNVVMPNITFDSVKEQYTQPDAKALSFTNNCSVALTSPVITIISGGTNFELVTTSVPGNIEAGATNNTSYAIKPIAGLTRGTYEATIQLAANELVTPITATVTFVVDALTYDINFDANGGSGTMTKVTHDTKDGQYTIPACTFTAPAGKVFDYWYMDNANNHLQAGDKVTLSSNATLKAMWKDDPSIAHNIVVNGGTANVATATQGTTITITAPDVSGKIFTGWTVVKGGISVAQSASATTTFTMPYADVEITANYVDVNVTMSNITFDSVKEQYTQPSAKPIAFTNNCGVRLTSPVITIIDGATNFELVIGSVPGAIEAGATDSTSYAIKPKAGLTRGTYTATIQLAANELVTPITATVTFVVDALTYTVTFDANGGTGSMTPVTHDTKDGQYTIPACTFTAPAGKVFDYWFIDVATTNLHAGDKVSLSSNATLKAMWKNDPSIAHEIKVNNGNASVATATQGTTITITAPDVSGKIFTGWTVNKGGVTVANTKSATFEMPYADVEITANYVDVNVAMPNITFDSVKVGYTQPSAKVISFTNNCTVRLTSPVITIKDGGDNFELVITSVPGAIEAGATNNTSYSIKPKTGLAKGTYTATIQLAANELVTPITATVTFTVEKASGGGSVTPPVHTHNYGTTWKTDGTNHWHECSCGAKKDSAAHSGGTATCEAKAKCSVCNVEYGELAEHKYSEATCTAKAKCSVCNVEKGDLAPHSYVEGKCSCGATDPNYVAPHTHAFVEGKCECGETDPNYQPPHEHTFVEGKCECGETDPNYVPPHEHSFVEGKCECGETDPNYTPGTDDPQTPDDNDGLPTGAIIAIVAGSVVVGGAGIFALVWFVIKKKTWAEFLAIFKKG